VDIQVYINSRDMPSLYSTDGHGSTRDRAHKMLVYGMHSHTDAPYHWVGISPVRALPCF